MHELQWLFGAGFNDTPRWRDMPTVVKRIDVLRRTPSVARRGGYYNVKNPLESQRTYLYKSKEDELVAYLNHPN